MYPPQQPPQAPMGQPQPAIQPMPQAPLTDPTIQRPMAPEQFEQWQTEIAQARDLRTKVSAWWDANLKAYAPAMDQAPDKYAENLNTNRDFTLVERKKADLFYQRPDIIAQPSPRLEGQEALLQTHQNILNEKLGPDGVDAEALVEKVLFDILCTAGMGWTVMGYDAATVDLETTVPSGETPTPGSVLGLNAAPTYQTTTVPVPIYQDCFWTWFSPKCGLIPPRVRTTDSDKWPWIGMDFELDARIAKRKGWIADDEEATGTDQDLRFDHGLSGDSLARVVRGTLIYYMSALYRDDMVHPLHVTRLILIDGKEEPVDHVDSPYQTLDAQGKLSPDSLIGYPIHPGSIRVLTDSPYVPSDCTISRPIVNELNKYREQMVATRDSQQLLGFYDAGLMPPEGITAIKNGAINGLVGLPSECFAAGDPIKPIQRNGYPRENFQINGILDNDLARTHAIDAEQSGARQEGEQSATEAAIKQNNVNARLSKERNSVLKWYLRGVTKYSSILQRLLPVEAAADIVGPAAAQQWDSWRKNVPAPLAFTALPDSTLRTDNAAEKKRQLDQYTFFANDPFVNRPAHLKHIFPSLGLPTSLVVDQPPERKPEPPKLTLSITAADLDPIAPNYGNVYQVLTQMGIQNLAQPTVDPMTAHMVQAATQATAHPQTEHGGKVPQAESLSKHAAALTGGMPGTGSQIAPQQGGVQ